MAWFVPLALLLGAPPEGGRERVKPPAVLEEVTRCRAIADPTQRLACFDARVADLAQAAETKSVVVLDKAEVQRTRRSLFGFTLPRLPFFGNDREDKEEVEAIRELTTTVVQSSPSGYGLWTLVLAEGGTWQTIEPDRRTQPQRGATIVIKRGLIGNYLANIGGARAVRIKRIG